MLLPFQSSCETSQSINSFNKNKNINRKHMLPPARTRSVEFPRPKIYLSHLNQLIDKKIIVQPEIEVNNKLFPQRDFAKRLATSHQRTKSSIQLRSQRFDLRWTSKKVKNLQIGSNKQPVVQSNQMRLELPRTKSIQLPLNSSAHFKDQSKKFYSTYTGLPHNSSPESQAASTNPSSPHKNYLRRGSNIQKQIVINLLRNKLLRQREENQRKQYSNSEIIKMIQVFKGVALDDGGRKGFLANSSRDRMKYESRGEHKELKGWDNEPLHDFQLHQEKQ